MSTEARSHGLSLLLPSCTWRGGVLLLKAPSFADSEGSASYGMFARRVKMTLTTIPAKASEITWPARGPLARSRAFALPFKSPCV